MGLTKSKGNMYDWVTHTHSHLLGACSHKCSYCYVQAMESRYQTGRYAGDVRLDAESLKQPYGSGKTIFIDHCNDLFAEDVHEDWIMDILQQCCDWPDNTYVFQSKNPFRMWEFECEMPPNRILGTTAESDMSHEGVWSECCRKPMDRLSDMVGIIHSRKFVTIEPILKMRNINKFADAIALAEPEFVNIGADSKRRGLPEPTQSEVMRLHDALVERGVAVLKKINLDRLMK